MNDRAFFAVLAPGLYRSTDRPIITFEDGEAWTCDYDALLADGRPIVLIIDAALRPSPQAGKPLALWLKARREVLARLVLLALYVVADETEREALADRAVASKAWPYPTRYVADFEEAERLGRETLADGPAALD